GLYENARAASRILLPERLVTQSDPDAALPSLAGADLTQVAVVDGRSNTAAIPDVASGQPPRRQATIVRYGDREVAIAADVDRPSLLVLTDSFYPGWRAAVDGREVSIARVDVLFRGVVVPAGTHRVRFWFDSLAVKLGGAV